VVVPHIPDDDLEAYALARLTSDRAEAMAGHLLLCRECQERLEAEVDFIKAFRAAVQPDKPGE
jgi:anti-sigma factor RsiW